MRLSVPLFISFKPSGSDTPTPRKYYREIKSPRDYRGLENIIVVEGYSPEKYSISIASPFTSEKIISDSVDGQ